MIGASSSRAQHDAPAIMAFLLSLMNPVSSSSLLFLARTWLVQLHNVCTSHASRPPAYVSQAWQGGLASTAHPCELFFHQAICTLKLSLPMGSPSSHLPTKTSNQYPRSPICRISKLLTTPPLLLTSRSNDPIAEKTQRSSSIYSPQMTSGGATCRMQSYAANAHGSAFCFTRACKVCSSGERKAPGCLCLSVAGVPPGLSLCSAGKCVCPKMRQAQGRSGSWAAIVVVVVATFGGG